MEGIGFDQKSLTQPFFYTIWKKEALQNSCYTNRKKIKTSFCTKSKKFRCNFVKNVSRKFQLMLNSNFRTSAYLCSTWNQKSLVLPSCTILNLSFFHPEKKKRSKNLFSVDSKEKLGSNKLQGAKKQMFFGRISYARKLKVYFSLSKKTEVVPLREKNCISPQDSKPPRLKKNYFRYVSTFFVMKSIIPNSRNKQKK